jgi:hypothetical protein
MAPDRQPSCRRITLAALLAAGCAVTWPAIGAEGIEFNGELRARADVRRLNAQGPLAAAERLSPGLAAPTPNTAALDAELRASWRPPRGGGPATVVNAQVLLSAQRPEGAAATTSARANELYGSADLGAWQLSAGKKVVGWDVGYGFRPNDVVQQEVRRTLLSVSPEGRPLLQAEHFDADTATALIWVNPQRARDGDDAQRFARESALAARWYHRDGAVDWHLFGRFGQHTGTSAGAALAWVATEALALHASARVMQRHDAWALSLAGGPAAGPGAVSANPWGVTTQGGAAQWLVGANWTGAQQQSVTVEAWHDGTAPGRSAWRDWSARNASLAAAAQRPGLPAAALTGLAGNLAWQATPLGAGSLHRDNVFVRLAWQPEPWQFTLDALVAPADRSHMLTAGVEWRGDRVRLNAGWRVLGGPADALVRQLPQRQVGALAATWAF